MVIKSPHIIATDDEPSILRLYTQLFRKSFNATVQATTDSSEALALATRQPPDLFITDLAHPSPDGVEVIRRLRSETKTKNVLIWVISGNAAKTIGTVAFRAGADLLLEKPFPLDEMIDRASRLFQFIGERDTQLLEFGVEAPDLDYKEKLDLDTKNGRAAFAKDVIAMANFGGGHIIVGFAEKSKGTFNPVGISATDQEKYEVTNINKSITDYLDPTLHVSSRIIKWKNLLFVVIDVPKAGDIIVLARKENPASNLYAGRIYTRNSSAESCEVKRSEEIRRIIERIFEQRVNRTNRPTNR